MSPLYHECTLKTGGAHLSLLPVPFRANAGEADSPV